MKMIIKDHNVTIRKTGKVYVADVSDLGISDFGKTLKETKDHVREAMECHIEGLAKILAKKLNI